MRCSADPPSRRRGRLRQPATLALAQDRPAGPGAHVVAALCRRPRTSARSGTSTVAICTAVFCAVLLGWRRALAQRRGAQDARRPVVDRRHERGPYLQRALVGRRLDRAAARAASSPASSPTARSRACRSRTRSNIDVTATSGGGSCSYGGEPAVGHASRPPTSCTSRSAGRSSCTLQVRRRDPQPLGAEPGRQEGPDPGPHGDAAVPRRPARPLSRPVRRVLRLPARVHGVRGDRRSARRSTTPGPRRSASPRPSRPTRRRGAARTSSCAAPA